MSAGMADDETGGATCPGYAVAVPAREAVPALLAEAGVALDDAVVGGVDERAGDVAGVTPLYCLSSPAVAFVLVGSADR